MGLEDTGLSGVEGIQVALRVRPRLHATDEARGGAPAVCNVSGITHLLTHFPSARACLPRLGRFKPFERAAHDDFPSQGRHP